MAPQDHIHEITTERLAALKAHGHCDPVSRKPFETGDRVVLCTCCQSVYLQQTWTSMGGCALSQRRESNREFIPQRLAPNRGTQPAQALTVIEGLTLRKRNESGYRSDESSSDNAEPATSGSSATSFFFAALLVVMLAVGGMYASHQNDNAVEATNRSQVAQYLTLAEQGLARENFEHAEENFLVAFKIAKSIDLPLAKKVATRRDGFYNKVLIPSGKMSQSYKIHGRLYFLFKPGRDGGYYFTANESSRLVGTRNDIMIQTSTGQTYPLTKNFRPSHIFPLGRKYGPFKTQDNASPKLYFWSKSGKPANVFVVWR